MSDPETTITPKKMTLKEAATELEWVQNFLREKGEMTERREEALQIALNQLVRKRK